MLKSLSVLARFAALIPFVIWLETQPDWCSASNQVPRLELEIRRVSGEMPVLCPIPEPGGFMGCSLSIPVPPTPEQEDRRIRLKFRIRQPVPGDLEVQVSMVVTTGREDPESKPGTDLGLYRAPARVGTELKVPALQDYLIDPALRVLETDQTVSEKPELTNLPASLRVTGIKKSRSGIWEVRLRNSGTLDVYAIVSQVPGRGYWDQESYYGGRPLVQAQGSGMIFLPLLEESEEWKTSRERPTLVPVAAVYYSDGTCEGDRVQCARLTATRQSRREEVSRQLRILAKVSVGEILLDVQAFLAHLPEEPPIAPLVENSEEAALLDRFPELAGPARREALYQIRTTTRNLRAELRSLIESIDKLRDRPEEILKRVRDYLLRSNTIISAK